MGNNLINILGKGYVLKCYKFYDIYWKVFYIIVNKRDIKFY